MGAVGLSDKQVPEFQGRRVVAVPGNLIGGDPWVIIRSKGHVFEDYGPCVEIQVEAPGCGYVTIDVARRMMEDLQAAIDEAS